MSTPHPAVHRDWTEGPILRTVMELAWPSVLSMTLMTAFAITNAFFLGRLGTVPLAAAISAIFVVWMIQSVVQIVTSGATAVVARWVGEGEVARAGDAARQALWWGLGLAALLTVAGHFVTPLAFDIMGTDPDVTREGTIYLRIMFYGSVFLVIKETLGAVFQATGDTRTPLYVNLMAVGLNVILDPILIFGLFGCPRLETAGAAIGTVSAYAAASLIYIVRVKAGRLRLPLRLSMPERPDYALAWRMFKIGFPLSFADIVFCTVYIFLNQVVAGYGAFAIAALGIGNRMESVNYMVAHGFGIAAATLVGQNLGAGKPDRAERSAWYTAFVVMAFTGAVGLLVVTFRSTLASVFLTDAQARGALDSYLILLGSTQIFMGAEIVLYFAFTGAGYTLWPSVVSIPGAVLRIPIAYVIGQVLGFGLVGVWWAITITMVLKGIALCAMFRMNRWKHQTV
jgi:putative MATE family efflux protein